MAEIETCYRSEDDNSTSLLTVHLDAAGAPALWFKPAFDIPKCVTGHPDQAHPPACNPKPIAW
ncbi:MAG: hypothetical protein ABJE66_17085 [Deltaproteobacteria bacterium]